VTLDRARIYRSQMQDSGKPASVIDKIVEGKLGSYYSQFVLPDQPSIRDPKISVKDVIAAASKSLGTPVSITRFARLKVGETTS
jgi:elongation factor Ts